MYMKVFAHGRGSGAKAIDYVIDPRRKGREESPPEVLRGEPEAVQRVIGSTDRVWKFTSGVLSWAPQDKVSPQLEKEVMDDFEKFAFAGLEPDQYSILWVRHSHAGHHEMHFIIPRTELRSDKAMNPCPPNWHKQYDVWRDLWNERMEWAKPNELKRSRLLQPGKDIHSPKGKQLHNFRKTVTDFLAQGIADGLHKDRADLVNALEGEGLSVVRQGKKYITLELPEDKTRVRLKGGIYESSWRAERQIERANEIAVAGSGAGRKQRIERLERELVEICRKRAEFHHSRYGRPHPEAQEKAVRDFGKLLETTHLGEHRIRAAVAHNIGLHNRILRLENQKEPRGINKNQRAGRESEKEHKQIYGMGDQGISDRQSAVSGLSQGGKSENRTDKQRPASRFIAEVDHERVIKELVGGPSRNGKGAVPPLERAGSENCRAGEQDFGAGKGSSGLPGLAERIGRCFAEAYEVARVRGKRIWRGMGR
ncbi:relaxase/mobilization nuclease domain-containing protein [Maridesulfovibrio sp.]|uniref:relaxase/mobilization nuclease domain-containing protein n=1 Tax=Maridesulfovibrio sp. TaxID=2795000 RepID=UPI0039EED2A1